MKVTQKDIAEYLTINNGDLSSMINGNLGLSLNNALKIKEKTGLTIDAIYEMGIAEVVSYVKFKMTEVKR